MEAYRVVEMLRIPHCLDNRFADGGKVVSLTHRPHFTPQKLYYSASGTHFCQRLSKPQSLVRPEGLGKLKKITSFDLETATFQFIVKSLITTLQPARFLYLVPNFIIA
jgi:hypothetical protein